MAHYAIVDSNNIVVSVITGRDETESVAGITDWEAYYTSQRPGYRAIRTSYNTLENKHLAGGTPFRGNYAAVGDYYDPIADVFVSQTADLFES
jgi:hypothetical protein